MTLKEQSFEVIFFARNTKKTLKNQEILSIKFRFYC
nr:MAG TPA: hypothetical protein [Caudoviricetes sp.]